MKALATMDGNAIKEEEEENTAPEVNGDIELREIPNGEVNNGFYESESTLLYIDFLCTCQK